MRRFLFALVLTVYSVLAFAKDKVEISSEPSWLVPVKIDPARKPDLKNVSSGYFFELYDNQINLVTRSSYTHFIRNIVNESGVQNASEISVDFVPSYQTVIFHKVVIIRNGEVINQLNRKDIKVIQEEAQSGDFQYNGNKRAFIILKNVRKGDRIEASYSTTGSNPIFDGKCSIELPFYLFTPVTNWFKTIISEDTRKLNFTYFLDAPHPAQTLKGNMRVYHWSNLKGDIYKSQTGAPSWYNAYPYITITDFNNWQEVAEWGLKLMNNYQFELPAPLLEKINFWKKSANGSKDEFARLALRYVQDDIRYLGIEEGIHTHKPHDPAFVFHHGYGDCKDKSLLLSAILRHDSITAYVALVNTVQKVQLSKAAPNPREFDHAIVAIARKGTFKFVDPTRSMQKGSLQNSYVPPYSFALILREKETDLWTMSVDGSNSTSITENYKFSFDDTTRLQVSTKYLGSYADNTRSYFSEFSENEIREKYEGYYSPIFKNIKMDGDLSYKDDSATNTIWIKEKYTIPSAFTVDDKKEKLVKVYARAIDEELSEPSAEGEMYPVALKFPCEIQFTMKLDMPEKWSFPNDKVHILNGDYQFDYYTTVSENKIILNYYYKTFSDHIAVENLSEYREDYREMSETVEYDLTYSPGANNFLTTPGAEGKVHWPSLLITGITGGLMIFLLARLNKRSIDVEYDRSTGWPLGGWMVVLGISIGIGVLVNFYHLFFNGFYQHTTWDVLAENGKALAGVAYMELFFQVVLLSSSIAVLVWYLKKRDIFPAMFVYYVGMMVSMQVILWISYYFINLPTGFEGVKNEAWRDVLRSLVYGAIWTTYVMRSYRTKATFLKSE